MSCWCHVYSATCHPQPCICNTSHDDGVTLIWQDGVGLAADSNGNTFVKTAEVGANGFDVPSGGQTYCNSVLKLSPDLTVADYFTPSSVAYLNSHDLDLSSTRALILHDQHGPYPHELIAGGKELIVYVLNRDHPGLFSPI